MPRAKFRQSLLTQRLDDALDNPLDPRYTPATSTTESDNVRRHPLTDDGRCLIQERHAGYNADKPALINDLSLELKPGTPCRPCWRVGLWQDDDRKPRSRTLDAWSGSITYDGRTINEIDPVILATQMAKVDQTIMLFKAQFENITLWTQRSMTLR